MKTLKEKKGIFCLLLFFLMSITLLIGIILLKHSVKIELVDNQFTFLQTPAQYPQLLFPLPEFIRVEYTSLKKFSDNRYEITLQAFTKNGKNEDDCIDYFVKTYEKLGYVKKTTHLPIGENILFSDGRHNILIRILGKYYEEAKDPGFLLMITPKKSRLEEFLSSLQAAIKRIR